VSGAVGAGGSVAGFLRNIVKHSRETEESASGGGGAAGSRGGKGGGIAANAPGRGARGP
jgi:hypothetical protein